MAGTETSPEFWISLLALTQKGLDLVQGFKGKGTEVLKQHLEFLRDQIELHGKSQARNEEELRQAKKRITELEDELAKSFRWYGGALFRVLPSEKLDHAVYCPSCRSSCVLLHGGAFGCKRCEWWISGLNRKNLHAALLRVAGEHGVDLAEPLFEVQEGEGGPQHRKQQVLRLGRGGDGMTGW